MCCADDDLRTWALRPVDVADVVAADVLGIGSLMSIRELATDAVSLSVVAD
jgi:hypothetical protein